MSSAILESVLHMNAKMTFIQWHWATLLPCLSNLWLPTIKNTVQYPKWSWTLPSSWPHVLFITQLLFLDQIHLGPTPGPLYLLFSLMCSALDTHACLLHNTQTSAAICLSLAWPVWLKTSQVLALMPQYCCPIWFTLIIYMIRKYLRDLFIVNPF